MLLLSSPRMSKWEKRKKIFLETKTVLPGSSVKKKYICLNVS